MKYGQYAALKTYIIGICSTDRYRPSLGKIALESTPHTLVGERISLIVQQEHNKRSTVRPPTWRVYLWQQSVILQDVYLRQQSVERVTGRGGRSVSIR